MDTQFIDLYLDEFDNVYCFESGGLFTFLETDDNPLTLGSTVGQSVGSVGESVGESVGQSVYSLNATAVREREPKNLFADLIGNDSHNELGLEYEYGVFSDSDADRELKIVQPQKVPSSLMPPKQKKLCSFHKAGYCAKGMSCRFTHATHTDIKDLASKNGHPKKDEVKTVESTSTRLSASVSTSASTSTSAYASASASDKPPKAPSNPIPPKQKKLCSFHKAGTCGKGMSCRFTHIEIGDPTSNYGLPKKVVRPIGLTLSTTTSKVDDNHIYETTREAFVEYIKSKGGTIRANDMTAFYNKNLEYKDIIKKSGNVKAFCDKSNSKIIFTSGPIGKIGTITLASVEVALTSSTAEER